MSTEMKNLKKAHRVSKKLVNTGIKLVTKEEKLQLRIDEAKSPKKAAKLEAKLTRFQEKIASDPFKVLAYDMMMEEDK